MVMVKVGLHPSVLNGNNQALRTKVADYPMRRTKIKPFTISRGDMHAVKNIYTGQIPAESSSES